jgi:hypothetical protein
MRELPAIADAGSGQGNLWNDRNQVPAMREIQLSEACRARTRAPRAAGKSETK